MNNPHPNCDLSPTFNLFYITGHLGREEMSGLATPERLLELLTGAYYACRKQ